MEILAVIVLLGIVGWPIILASIFRYRNSQELELREKRRQREREDGFFRLKMKWREAAWGDLLPLRRQKNYFVFENIFDARVVLRETLRRNGIKACALSQRVHLLSQGSSDTRGRFVVFHQPNIDLAKRLFSEVTREIDSNAAQKEAGIGTILIRESSSGKEKSKRIERLRYSRFLREAKRSCRDLIDESDLISAPYSGAVAVYVMASAEAAKIGVSERPEQRLREVQTGSAAKVKLVASYWLPSRHDAFLVERAAHSELAAAGISSRGEWFKTVSGRARSGVESAILQLARDSRIAVPLDEEIVRTTNGYVPVGVQAEVSWRRSRKGNWFVAVNGKRITVFRRPGGRWSFVVDGVFSKKSYSKLAEARREALRFFGSGNSD